jgi:S1-C subfamily serine protease
MPIARRTAVRAVAGAVAAMAVAGAVSACSVGSDDKDIGADTPHTTRTTRVQVVEGLGRKGGLDAAALYDRLSPGVVTIISLFGSSGSVLGSENGEGGQGSGFVLDGGGYIATNAHVVTDGQPPDTKKAEQVYVEFSDGNRVPARVVGYDLNADTALLKVDPAGLKLTPIRLGHSGDLTVGAPVAAIGSPFGERQSLSVGVISALDRSIESLTQFQIGDAIQTDAAINPGNSGGPLLNAKGHVLGINSQIKSTSGGGEGVGFAIPVDTVRRSLAELRKDGKVDYGYVGVTSQPLYPQLARRLKLPVSAGALVVQVEDGSPADDAGLSKGDDTIGFQGQRDIPSNGDVIIGVDGRRLSKRDDLADLVGAHDAGETVTLEVIRDGKRRTVKVKLGERPERPPKGG